MSLYKDANRVGDLIGSAVERLSNLSNRHARRVSQATENEEAWFSAMLQNGTIRAEKVGHRIIVFAKADIGISTGVDLNTGSYALGSRTLEPGILYLARRYAGWKDPTGARRRKVK